VRVRCSGAKRTERQLQLRSTDQLWPPCSPPVNTAPPHPQAFIDKFRYNAKRASLVQSRIKALERMAEVQVRCHAAQTQRQQQQQAHGP
jgi:ATPase subunit of ABC transporter with duplicated ATPase domains